MTSATAGPRRIVALLAALLLLATGQTLPANAAPDNATLELSKVVTGWAENTTVRPGQSFGYTLELSCNNSNFGGCDDAFLLDPIPAGLLLDGDSAAIKVTGSGVATRVRIEAPQTVRVDVINDLGDGKVGMAHGTTITVVVPVRVDPDLAQSASGTPIINTATADATNAPNEEASFPVKPEVPIVTAAVPAKSFDPEGGLAAAGVKTTLKAQAANGSNVSVDAITITDPADPTAKPFQHLALTGALDVKLPDGAEHVRVDVMVGGAWVEGTAGPLPAELPDSVTPSDVEGIRLTFLSTDGPDIAPGATGSFDLGLVSRPSIATSGPIVNTIAATVTVGETTSTPGTTTATYTPAAADIPVAATKTFTPDVITAGKQSTVALTATNTSSHTLETLTITEPGSGANPLADTLTFAGWATSGVQWPNGATGLTVTYQVERDGEIVTVTEAADTPNTLPAAPADGRVIGFTATYSGAIVPGAEAKLPFTVSTDAAQAVDLAKHPNDIVVTSVAPGGYAGSTTAADELTTYKRRLDLEVGKKISPSSIVGTAGEDVVVRLTGHLLPFPQSTTEATTVIISDPADVAADAWYDSFAPTRIASTPVPTNATLTVQYFDGTAWHDVEGMVGLTGGVHTVDFPATVRDSALGIRFVYESTDGLAPDTRLAPNLGFELRATATESFTAANCAAASAAADLVEPADAASPCPTITVSPEGTGPGGGAPVTIDKSWASSTIPQRLLAGTTVTLSWATHRSNLGKVVVSDGAAPSAATLPGSAFNSFDLLSIPAIWPSDDPLIAFDRVARVELYSLSRDAWVAKTGDPCPQGCDGQFPGVTLSDAERADTIGVRLVFEESPTRIDRIQNDPEAPAVGSGVARSLPGQSRPLKLTMRLRDELRKSPSGAPEPVLYSSLLGTRQPGEVPNDAGVTGWTDPTGSPVASDRDEASITVTDVPPTVKLDKTWSGGPLAVPQEGTPFPDKWPTARLVLKATNTTPARVDELIVTDPVDDANSPFASVNIARIAISEPAGERVQGTITLRYAGGTTGTFTPAQAQALSESDLRNVVGLTARWSGRIDQNAVATIRLDTRLRETVRGTTDRVLTGSIFGNVGMATVSDLIDYDQEIYPKVTASHRDDAILNTVGEQITVDVTKTITPDAQREPDRGPVTVALTGQPTGPSRSDELHITDTDATFFNAFDFTGFQPVAFTSPIDKVRVDVLTGGTFSVVGGTVEVTDAVWVHGTPITADNATPTLPAGVSADQVRGVRYVFTKQDGSIMENPANPVQRATFTVTRRTTLRTGGAVPSTMQGQVAAPGEAAPGVFANTVTADTWGPSIGGGDRLHADKEATDDVTYQHALNKVTVKKSTPSTTASADAPIPYTLTFTNSGSVPIVDPVITDVFPTDAKGPQLIVDPEADPASVYTFTLAGAAPLPANGTPLPTALEDVQVGATPLGLTFRFAEGSVLEVGQTYTIRVNLSFRPGLDAATEVVNTTGISGERPWDSCSGTLVGKECTTTAKVTVQRSGALQGSKLVRAVDTELGVLDTRATGCTPDADGFYRGGCVPVTKPGGDEIWRLRWTNIGNLPLEKVTALDQLPAIGDAGVITGSPRGSKWRPIPKKVTFVGSVEGTVSSISVDWSSNPDLCSEDLNATSTCTTYNWKSVGEEASPANGWTVPLPEGAQGLRFTFKLADQPLKPLGTIVADITTTTPAQSPTVDGDTIAWNNIAQSATARNGDKSEHVRRNEANKVGVALAVAPVTIEKLVTGEGSAFAPDRFELNLACTSVGEAVTLGERANVSLGAGEPVTVGDIPWGSSCTVGEDAAASGASGFQATTVIVNQRDAATAAAITATNRYDLASLKVAKRVSQSAVDQEGTALDHGEFDFTAACTFLGSPVTAEGFEAGKPMTFTLGDGDSRTLTGLPAGAACTVTETTPDNLETVSYEWTAGEVDIASGTGAASGQLASGANTIAFANAFRTSKLALTKLVVGDGADLYGGGEFSLNVACVDPSGREVWNDDITLGGEHGLTHTIDGLWADATCTVTEPRTGGATETTFAPGDGTLTLVPGETSTVTVSNSFDVGSVRVAKTLDGDGADLIDDINEFEVQLACVADVDGTEVDVPLPDDGRVTLSKATTLEHSFDNLPIGARCTLTEPDAGGAVATSIEPATVTVGEEPVDISVVNTFTAASLTLTKSVASPALDADGEPIDHGTFDFSVACTFQGRDVVAAGFTAGEEMSVSLGHAQSTTLTGLPTGTSCRVTEQEAPHVASVSATWTTGSVASVVDGNAAEGTLAADIDGTSANSVAYRNEMRTSELTIDKVVTGPGAERYSPDAFTVAVACVDADDRIVWDGEVPFGGEHGMSATIERLWADATCTVSEPITGGATRVDFAPEGPVTLDPGTPGTVTVTNTFEVGSVEVTKVIDGSGAEFLHPDTQFQLQLACEADVDGERLPVALDDDGLRTISPATGLSARFDELPVGAECTLTEPDNGGAVATAITPERITVGGEAARITVTNTFEAASLEVSKVVTTSALDAAGEPVDHGPFGFTVACHYLDRPVVAEGFTAGEPMRISLSDGQSRTLTGLVAGTACEITEDAAANLASVESTWRAQDAEVEADGTTAQGVLIADVEGAATNAVAFRNAFRTSELAISKVVEGPGAALYSTDAFLVDVTCVDDSGREVWHDSLPFGGEHGYEAKITDLWADATCSLSEPVSGGATSVEFSPADTVELSPEAAARVEVVNHFDLGEVAIHKLLEGPGAPSVPGDATFVVSLECSADVDGERTAIDLPDGGRVTLSRAGGLDAVISDLPQGATCTATETETGGADASRITPERIVVGEDAGFTVINTFQTSPIPPTPGPTPQGPDTQTGVGVGGDRPFGPLIGAAVAASVAVAGLMMARRRRGA